MALLGLAWIYPARLGWTRHGLEGPGTAWPEYAGHAWPGGQSVRPPTFWRNSLALFLCGLAVVYSQQSVVSWPFIMCRTHFLHSLCVPILRYILCSRRLGWANSTFAVTNSNDQRFTRPEWQVRIPWDASASTTVQYIEGLINFALWPKRGWVATLALMQTKI